DRRAEDGADLHLEDLGVYEQQAAPTQAKHWIVLVKLLQPTLDLLLALELRAVLPGRPHHRDIDVDVRILAEEFVERRVDEADDDGKAVHRLVHLEEVALLERKELRERPLPALYLVGHDHVLHDRQAFGLPEHVLGPREADALRAKLACQTALL